MANKFSSSTASFFSTLYSPDKLFSKITDTAKKAGVKVIYAALLLYYALTDNNVPLKDKVIVIGALGYFICPVDAVPDFLPGGYLDDGGALILALKSIWSNITSTTKAKALNRLQQWFDDITASDLVLF